MRSFKDKHGTEWTVDVDLSLINRVRSATGINLIDLVLGKAGDDVAEDLEKQGQILWAVCEDQARARNASPETFAKGMNGESMEKGFEAIAEGVADFLSPTRRDLARKVMEKGKAVQAAALDLVNQKLDALDPSKLAKALSDGSVNSGASQASTQAT